MIRHAKVEDIGQILDITRKVNINNVLDTSNGFLLTERSYDFYENTINSNYFYVYEINDKIVGFIIAYPKEMIESMEKIDEYHAYLLENFKNENFIFIFQIAIDPEFQKQGIGKELHEYLFENAEIKNFIVATSKKPLNEASRIFHKKLGFEDIDTFTWSTGYENYIYRLKK